jgi:hypothetical protein
MRPAATSATPPPTRTVHCAPLGRSDLTDDARGSPDFDSLCDLVGGLAVGRQ